MVAPRACSVAAEVNRQFPGQDFHLLNDDAFHGARNQLPLGFMGQGSVHTRRITCGRATCRCHDDPDARHGPYHYWTRKARGKTVGLKLTEDELVLYREWIENNRKLERLVKEMRHLSSCALALITGRQAP